MTYSVIKKRLDVSDGAIGPQLLKLEEIRYVSCRKSFVGRRPKSTYRMTPTDRKALKRYIAQMQKLIDTVSDQLT